MRNRTICFFNTTRAWGGGEKWHHDMALRLRGRGWRVVTVADRDGELYRRLSRADMPLYGIKAGNLGFLSRKRKKEVEHIFVSEQVDTVIMNLPADLKLAAPVASACSVARVIYRRGSAIPIRDSWLNRRLFGRYVTGVIANSKETSRTILARNPDLFDSGRIKVIYNGIDLKEWDSIADSMIYQAQPGTLVIGNAGRLTRQKGQETLVRTAVELKELGTDFIMLVAGEGPLREKLEEKAARAGVGDRMIFTGFVRNMKSFMASLHVFVLTSRWEGFGYVLVEAMASGLPVVALDNSSNPEIVEDGVTGFLAEDSSAITSKIAQLGKSPDLRARMGAAGRSRVEELFTLDRAVAELEAYLEAPPRSGAAISPGPTDTPSE